MKTVENKLFKDKTNLMVSPRKKLVINSTIYFVGNILVKAVSFLLLPIYTKLFSPAEYGAWGVMLSFTVVLAIFFELGLHDAVGRFYYKYYQNENLLRAYFSTIFNTLVIITVALGILLIILSPYLSIILLGNKIYLLIIILLIIDTGFSSFVRLFTNLFQYAEKALHFSAIQLSKSILNLVLIIILVVYYKIGILGFAISLLSVNVLFFIICSILFRKFLIPKIHIPYLKKSIVYGMPFFLTAIFGWIAVYSTILYITKLQNVYYAGLFSMAFQISLILGLICISVQRVWNPIFMKNLEAKKPNFLNRIVQFQTFYMSFIVIIGLGISFLSKEFFVLFLNPRYHEAWIIVPILIYYYLFSAMGQQFSLKLCFVQKTKYLFYTNLIAITVSVLANIILIKYFSFIGAAIAMVIVSITTATIYFYYSQRFMHLVYEFKKMCFILFVCIIGTTAAISLNFPLIYNIILKGGIFIFLIFVFMRTNILPYRKIKSIVNEFNFWEKFFKPKYVSIVPRREPKKWDNE